VDPASSVTMRTATLVRESGDIDAVLRSSTSPIELDHHRATLRRESDHEPQALEAFGEVCPWNDPALLYHRLLFHGPRFQRVRRYRHLSALGCEVELRPGAEQRWFSAYLPGTLLLGDPGLRDAALHTLQACVPHLRLIPVSVERVKTGVLDPSKPYTVRARQRWRRGDRFLFDLTLSNAIGAVVERWDGLCLQRAGTFSEDIAWPAPLLACYLQRRLEELGIHANLTFTTDTSATSGAVVRQAISRRPDGKPMRSDGRHMSRSHHGGLTMTASSGNRLGCDLEAACARDPSTWMGLLGASGWTLVERCAQACGETQDASATRLWCALECAQKAGLIEQPMRLHSIHDGGWVQFSCGDASIATALVRVQDLADPLIAAVLSVTARSQRDAMLEAT